MGTTALHINPNCSVTQSVPSMKLPLANILVLRKQVKRLCPEVLATGPQLTRLRYRKLLTKRAPSLDHQCGHYLVKHTALAVPTLLLNIICHMGLTVITHAISSQTILASNHTQSTILLWELPR